MSQIRWPVSSHAARLKLLIEMFGAKCVDCGSSERLVFHHRDPAAKEFALGANTSRPLQQVLKEAEKCDLVCASCHSRRHIVLQAPSGDVAALTSQERSQLIVGATQVIERLMHDQGVSRSELARRVGVHKAQITRTLSSTSSSYPKAPSLNTLQTYATALGHQLVVNAKPLPRSDQPKGGSGKLTPKKKGGKR